MNTFYDKQEGIRKSIYKALGYAFPVISMVDEFYVQSPVDIFNQEVFYKVDKWARTFNYRWSVVHELDHVLIHIIPLKTL